MHNTDHKDDLDYLAALGFEAVKTGGNDLADLRGRVRKKTFSHGTDRYFSFVSLLTGVFLGVTLFFTISEPAADRAPLPVLKEIPAEQAARQSSPIALDTIEVSRDNFVNPARGVQTGRGVDEEARRPSRRDSFEVITGKEADLTALLKQPLTEEKVKFMANAPVFYIHDLKVTDYSTLYFKKNQFIRFEGTTAEKANRAVAESTPGLKQQPDYFLHEELAQALLYFKKGLYDLCLERLNSVAGFNDHDINCSFYLGMCYYHKKNYLLALRHFDCCIADLNNTFLQEATFYKAMALYESGRVEEGITLFRSIASEDGFYAKQAKEMMGG